MIPHRLTPHVYLPPLSSSPSVKEVEKATPAPAPKVMKLPNPFESGSSQGQGLSSSIYSKSTVLPTSLPSKSIKTDYQNHHTDITADSEEGKLKTKPVMRPLQVGGKRKAVSTEDDSVFTKKRASGVAAKST
jgi:hypothetical protein